MQLEKCNGCIVVSKSCGSTTIMISLYPTHFEAVLNYSGKANQAKVKQAELMGLRVEESSFPPPTYSFCRYWELNLCPSGYESKTLNIRPQLPLIKHIWKVQPNCLEITGRCVWLGTDLNTAGLKLSIPGLGCVWGAEVSLGASDFPHECSSLLHCFWDTYSILEGTASQFTSWSVYLRAKSLPCWKSLFTLPPPRGGSRPFSAPYLSSQPPKTMISYLNNH